MLKIIDTKWREHLYEMDYLQEGINLRAMGQKDPLTEWQREGYEMFGMMMKGIAQDLVRYVMHVQVTVQQPTAPAVGTDFGNGDGATPSIGGDEPAVQNVQYSSPDEAATGGGMAAAARQVATEGGPGAAPAAVADQPATMTPVVKSEWDKTPRNAPCPCGSGKKFKLCHGKA
jgi:preprotein translocase subunit SecA